MDANVLGVMIPMVVSVSMFALIFGIFYLRNRERMGMIERGMDPTKGTQPLNRNNVLTFGLLMVGSGLGLFLAFILDNTLYFLHNPDNNTDGTPLYFALIGIFGGLGLYVAYLIDRKNSRAES
jgi:hypothetical protein